MNREAWTTSRSWPRTNLRREARACCTGGSAQNRAASVCSALRVVLVLEPISLTSLYSRAQRLLERADGPCGRYWSADVRLNGSIRPR